MKRKTKLNTITSVKIIASNDSWIEGLAVQQLETVANMPGVQHAIGMPDLHPGKGVPVGVAIVTKDIIYPHLVGNDIGCGMAMFKTGLSRKKVKLDKWVTKFKHILSGKYEELHVNESAGSIGGGNHFAEIQQVHEVYDSAVFADSQFDVDAVYILVHSGSRGLGQQILDTYIRSFNAQHGLAAGSQVATAYLKEHADAVTWAAGNRERIAEFMQMVIGGKADMLVKLSDNVHNSVSVKKHGADELFIHRKGAAASDKGLVMIPGSRGSLSYLVKPKVTAMELGYSLAHGAGRKWQRSECKGKLQGKYLRKQFNRTGLNSRVVYRDIAKLYEEAPEAYKNIDQVLLDMQDVGLITTVASFKPLITYKD